MLHIIGNAMGLFGQPPADGIVAQARRFGLTTLPRDASQPMLVINGDADRFIANPPAVGP